jgi:hypothetical protein
VLQIWPDWLFLNQVAIAAGHTKAAGVRQIWEPADSRLPERSTRKPARSADYLGGAATGDSDSSDSKSESPDWIARRGTEIARAIAAVASPRSADGNFFS